MPSAPSLQAWANTSGPSAEMCSLNRITPDGFNRDANVALRVSSGMRRRSLRSYRGKLDKGREAAVNVLTKDAVRPHRRAVRDDRFSQAVPWSSARSPHSIRWKAEPQGGIA